MMMLEVLENRGTIRSRKETKTLISLCDCATDLRQESILTEPNPRGDLLSMNVIRLAHAIPHSAKCIIRSSLIYFFSMCASKGYYLLLSFHILL